METRADGDLLKRAAAAESALAALKAELDAAKVALEKIATARVRSREDLMHIAKEALSQLNEAKPETTWQQDAAKVLNNLAKHDAESEEKK